MMPQFKFYKVPLAAKEIKFEQLFIDCFRQLYENPHAINLAPLLADKVNLQDCTIAFSSDCPEILFLSDLVKLFCSPKVLENSGSSPGNLPDNLQAISTGYDFHRVKVRVLDKMTPSASLRFIREAQINSPTIWTAALLGQVLIGQVQ